MAPVIYFSEIEERSVCPEETQQLCELSAGIKHSQLNRGIDFAPKTMPGVTTSDE